MFNFQSFLLSILKNQNLVHWDRVRSETWRDFVSPWRPSRDDISNYEMVVKRLNPRRCLLLGSTPEIRDVLYRSNKKVTVVDFSLKMIQRMGRLMKERNCLEEWIIKNWLAIDLPPESFDLVIGDLVFRLIPHQKQKRFLEKIVNLLEKKGLFLTRIHYINENLQRVTPDEMLKNIFRLYDLKEISFKESQNILISRLFDKFTNFDLHNVDQNKAYALLEVVLSKTTIRKQEIVRLAIDKWRKNYFTYTQLTKEELEVKLKKYFKIVDICIADDYIDASFYPIFLLRKIQNSYKEFPSQLSCWG